ncbi:MAG: MFS transporter, partial [Proteobacteria bacterium]|nr:MFS transporter [Pseudomonadota bacterium]
PLALITGTLQAWLTDEGLTLQALGNFSLVTLPYALKFLWSPLLDRFIPPLARGYGRRRGWMLVSQAALLALTVVLAQLHPSTQPYAMFIVAFLVAFASATQDVVVDAYRAELLRRAEQGPGASMAIFGYRVGMLTSGALALSMAQAFSWTFVYCVMAGLYGIGMLATVLAPELPDTSERPRTLNDAVVQPFVDYFRRRGALELLLFVLLYKIADVMAGMFTTRFMLEVGFSKAEIAAVVKGLGLIASIVGSLVGGISLVRLGMKRGLLVFGVLQGVSNLTFAALAEVGKDYGVMALAITVENLCAGLGTAAFAAFLTGLCNRRYTATQYALLTSLAAASRSVMGVPCGILASGISWSMYFVVCTAAALPGLLLLWARFERWSRTSEEASKEEEEYAIV